MENLLIDTRPDVSASTTQHAPTELKISVELVTPEMARNWLKVNTMNRPLIKTHVQFLAAQMRTGSWLMTGDPIKVSKTNRLLDGQHRLSALLESQTQQTMVIVRDMPDETFYVIDTGRVRLAQDVLSIAQVPNARRIASMARAIINYKRGKFGATIKSQGRHSGYAVTNGEILEFVNNEDLQPYANNAMGWYRECRLFTETEYAFFMYVLGNIDHAQADQFLSSISKGANLAEESPVFVLRKKLEQAKLNGISYTPTERLALVFKGWNLFRQSRTVKLLVWNPEKEDFPTPI